MLVPLKVSTASSVVTRLMLFAALGKLRAFSVRSVFTVTIYSFSGLLSFVIRVNAAATVPTSS